MSDRIIAGTVNADGSIRFGSDFTVTRTGEGQYLIAFRPAFASVSGGAASQIIFKNTDTRDNAVVLGLGPNDVLIKTGNGSGEGVDRDFTFVFAGTGTVSAFPVKT